MPENVEKIDLTENQDGGVMKLIKKHGVGSEQPPKGVKVEVDYTGRLTDGTVFDSSHNHGSRFHFNLGKGQVIKSWDLCVASMKKGEVCEVTCAAKYAYGKRGSPPKIPPNATLVFEIELYSWEGEDITEDQDKGILKETIDDATDSQQANSGATVDVSLVGKYDNKTFDDRRIKFIVDEDDDQLIPALPIAIKTMKTNERCRIVVSPKYAFGEEGSKEFNIPASSTVSYEITMNSLQRCKESWELSDEERINESLSSKEKGTLALKDKNHEKAEKLYNRAVEMIDYLDAKDTGSDEDKETVKKAQQIKLASYLNLSLVQSKMKKYADAVHSCDKALEIDEDNEKALFRKGEALYNQNNFHDAKLAFELARGVNSSNKATFDKLKMCTLQIKKQIERERNTFKGMFDKFVQQDEREEVRKKIKVQEEKAKIRAEKKASVVSTEEPLATSATGDN